MGPIPAWIYQFLGLLFGPSYLSHLVFSIFLLVFQAFLFNRAIYLNKAMPKMSNTPALMYVSFGILCHELVGLSPVFIALTFLIPALDLLMRDDNRGDKNVFWIGFYCGLAAFCVPELAVYLPFFVLALIIYQSYNVRQYLLVLLGFLVVAAIMATIYFISDSIGFAIQIYVLTIFQAASGGVVNVGQAFSIILVPLILLGLVISNTFRTKYAGNRQITQQWIFIFFTLVALAILLIHPDKPADLIILILPPLAFFGALFIMNLNSWTQKEGFYWIGVIVLLANTYLVYFPFANFSIWWNQSEHYNVYVPTSVKYENTKLAVFSSYPGLYKNNFSENPYLNWEISFEYLLKEMDTPESVLNAYKRLDGDFPEVIIADKGVMRFLGKFLPKFTQQFELKRTVQLLPDLKELEVFELKTDSQPIISEENSIGKS
jgi:hypothetical protein